MPPRKAKLNVSRGTPGLIPTVRITERDWRSIETAYKHRLSPQVRKEVLEITNDYLLFADGESTAERVDFATDHVERLHKGAAAFWNEFRQMSDSHADSLIVENFSKRWGKDGFNLFSEMMQSFLAICEFAPTELKNPANHGFRKGAQWSWWIRCLTEIMQEHGLPHQARKDPDKNKTGKPSHFVLFLRELQRCVPVEIRREHSLEAIATAITRARATNRVTNESA